MGTATPTDTSIGTTEDRAIPIAETDPSLAVSQPGRGPIPAASISSALYRLMTWLSPQFPIGGYTYSHGIEQAVEAGYVTTAATASAWIEDIIGHGAGRTDAILLNHAHAAASAGDTGRLVEVAEVAAVVQPAAELALESHAQGRAFLETVRKTWDCASLALLADNWPGPYALSVVVAVASAGHGIPVGLASQAHLQAFTANLVSAAVRLVPLGQTDGQKILAAAEPLIARVAVAAGHAALDDVGGANILGDICAMRHETQYTRLFRS